MKVYCFDCEYIGESDSKLTRSETREEPAEYDDICSECGSTEISDDADQFIEYLQGRIAKLTADNQQLIEQINKRGNK